MARLLTLGNIARTGDAGTEATVKGAEMLNRATQGLVKTADTAYQQDVTQYEDDSQRMAQDFITQARGFTDPDQARAAEAEMLQRIGAAGLTAEDAQLASDAARQQDTNLQQQFTTDQAYNTAKQTADVKAEVDNFDYTNGDLNSLSQPAQQQVRQKRLDSLNLSNETRQGKETQQAFRNSDNLKVANSTGRALASSLGAPTTGDTYAGNLVQLKENFDSAVGKNLSGEEYDTAYKSYKERMGYGTNDLMNVLVRGFDMKKDGDRGNVLQQAVLAGVPYEELAEWNKANIDLFGDPNATFKFEQEYKRALEFKDPVKVQDKLAVTFKDEDWWTPDALPLAMQAFNYAVTELKLDGEEAYDQIVLMTENQDDIKTEFWGSTKPKELLDTYVKEKADKAAAAADQETVRQTVSNLTGGPKVSSRFVQ